MITSDLENFGSQEEGIPMDRKVEREFSPSFEEKVIAAIKELQSSKSLEVEIPDSNGMKLSKTPNAEGKPVFAPYVCDFGTFYIYEG